MNDFNDAREAARQARIGAGRLADLEAELLGDDEYLRELLVQLAEQLNRWLLASDQAMAVRVQRDDGYTADDMTAALNDYRTTRAAVLDTVQTITDHTTTTEEEAP